MFPFYFDSSFLILIPAMLLAAYAQYKVSHNFNKYSKVTNQSGFTGREVARLILDQEGLSNVDILPIAGQLTDHYDPRSKEVSLSEGVYSKSSISSLAVASHEVGHALQDAENYTPLRFRNAIVPIVNFSSQLVWIFVMAGFILRMTNLITVGIWLFSASVVFSLMTLPVEINASRRAIAHLEVAGFLNDQELEGANEVLKAAAWTYIAASLMAVAQLLRLLMIRNRQR